MIEIMVIVKDSATSQRDSFYTDVIADAETLTDEQILEVNEATGKALAGALIRLQNKAELTNYYAKVNQA